MSQVTHASLQKLAKRFNAHDPTTKHPLPTHSITNLDTEPQNEYEMGGYCPVKVDRLYGERNRYRIVGKLGWGNFSTVWLAYDYDTNTFVAIKFQKSNDNAASAALDEIDLARGLHGASAVLHLSEAFDTQSENGRHTCMVFELMGENLLSLIRSRKYKGLPIAVVKRITRDLLQGLAQMHRVDVIHTDLKLENILLTSLPRRTRHLIENYTPPPKGGVPLTLRTNLEGLSKAQQKRLRKKMKENEALGLESSGQAQDGESSQQKQDQPEPVRITRHHEHVVKIADLGNGCWVHKQFTDNIQTVQYRSPEVILRAGYSTPADVWSAACIVFELLTGDFLFPGSSSREHRHLAMMIELLGEFSLRQLLQGKSMSKYFTSKGKLKRYPNVKKRSIASILQEKYKFSEEDARGVEEFLLPMLALDPAQRATAEEALKHEWLADVHVDMEIDEDILKALDEWLENPNRKDESDDEREETEGDQSDHENTESDHDENEPEKKEDGQ